MGLQRQNSGHQTKQRCARKCQLRECPPTHTHTSPMPAWSSDEWVTADNQCREVSARGEAGSPEGLSGFAHPQPHAHVAQVGEPGREAEPRPAPDARGTVAKGNGASLLPFNSGHMGEGRGALLSRDSPQLCHFAEAPQELGDDRLATCFSVRRITSPLCAERDCWEEGEGCGREGEEGLEAVLISLLLCQK